ncbi:MAG: AcrR family transcriptional regulator [Arenicella sp.]|jgi:AcrR family transcriptional regulator
MSRVSSALRRTQSERRTATRKTLLEATVTVLLDSGYDGCSLAKVAKQAGLTTGSVQHHFNTKSDLMLAVIRERIFAVSDMRGVAIDIDLAVAERCKKIVELQWKYYGDPKYLAIWTIILGARSDSEFTSRISDWQKNAIAQHEQGIKTVFSDLRLKPSQIKSLQYFINAQLRGLAMLQVIDSSPLLVKKQLKLLAGMLENHLLKSE